MKAMGKVIKTAEAAFKGLHIIQSTMNKPQKMTNSTSTDATYGGA